MFTDNHIKLLKVLPTNILTPFWEFSKRILNKSFSHKKIDRTKSLSGRFFSINILNVYFLYLFAPFSWAEGVAIKWNLSDLLCSPTLCNIVTPSPSPASLSPLITIWLTSQKITKFSNQHLPNWEEHQWPQLFDQLLPSLSSLWSPASLQACAPRYIYYVFMNRRDPVGVCHIARRNNRTRQYTFKKFRPCVESGLSRFTTNSLNVGLCPALRLVFKKL